MDSKKLEMLVTAADLGSFLRASEVVGYTQSGLTRMMDSLEAEIGFPLLERSRSGVRLTEQGTQLMPAIRDFLRTGTRLEQEILRIREQKTERIRVAAYASIAMQWMPEVLYRFRRECPNVTVELRMVDHAIEPFELLENGQTDVIFASRQPRMGCEWIPLYEEPLYAILPRSYPLNGRREFPLSEFDGMDFLMPYGRFDREVEAALAPIGVRIKAQESRVDDETVIRMVGRGLGVSLMGELMIRGRTDDVVCLPVSPRCVRELGIGVLPSHLSSGHTKKLIACVSDYVKTIGESGKDCARFL